MWTRHGPSQIPQVQFDHVPFDHALLERPHNWASLTKRGQTLFEGEPFMLFSRFAFSFFLAVTVKKIHGFFKTKIFRA